MLIDSMLIDSMMILNSYTSSPPIKGSLPALLGLADGVSVGLSVLTIYECGGLLSFALEPIAGLTGGVNVGSFAAFELLALDPGTGLTGVFNVGSFAAFELPLK